MKPAQVFVVLLYALPVLGQNSTSVTNTNKTTSSIQTGSQRPLPTANTTTATTNSTVPTTTHTSKNTTITSAPGNSTSNTSKTTSKGKTNSTTTIVRQNSDGSLSTETSVVVVGPTETGGETGGSGPAPTGESPSPTETAGLSSGMRTLPSGGVVGTILLAAAVLAVSQLI